MTKAERLDKATQAASDQLADKLKSNWVITIALVDDRVSVGSVTPDGSVNAVRMLLEKVLGVL